MPRARPGLVMTADTTEGSFLAGFMLELSQSVSTQAHQSAVVEAVHGHYSGMFDEWLSAKARRSPNRLHHMFEPRMIGVNTPEAKLWRHTRRGRGGSLQASWDFQPSRHHILTPNERLASRLDDPIKRIPGYFMRAYLEAYEENGAKTYVFHDKAIILEYDVRTRINPVNVRYLFVPDPSAMSGKGFRFSVDEFPDNAERGYKTTGEFTKAWTQFWGTVVPATFESVIGNEIERDIAVNARQQMRKRRRTFGFKVATDNKKAFAEGQARAKAAIDKNIRTLKRIERAGNRYSGIR